MSELSMCIALLTPERRPDSKPWNEFVGDDRQTRLPDGRIVNNGFVLGSIPNLRFDVTETETGKHIIGMNLHGSKVRRHPETGGLQLVPGKRTYYIPDPNNLGGPKLKRTERVWKLDGPVYELLLKGLALDKRIVTAFKKSQVMEAGPVAGSTAGSTAIVIPMTETETAVQSFAGIGDAPAAAAPAEKSPVELLREGLAQISELGKRAEAELIAKFSGQIPAGTPAIPSTPVVGTGLYDAAGNEIVGV